MSSPTLLRQVPGNTVIHRLWAGTKLVCVVLIGLTLTLVPSWPALGATAVLLAVLVAVARVPRAVLPHVPWWFWLALGLGALLNVPAGGTPEVSLGPVTVGLGAVLIYVRVTVLAFVLLGISLMVGLTTAMADIAPAFARLARPLKWLRLPVEEWAVTVGLCLRAVPLFAEEWSVLRAAQRLRPVPEGRRRRSLDQLFTEGLDMLSAAMAVSLRRSAELGDAVTARGGTGQLTARRVRLGLRDVVALVLVAAFCAALLVLA